MPNEPDNKMDDLLKAYARKRRAEAGEPMELHPATRRLLQAEAAKLRPATEQASRWWTNLFRSRWPGIAFAVGLFVLLGIGVRLMLPTHAPEDRQMFAKREAPATRDRKDDVRSEKEAEVTRDSYLRTPAAIEDEIGKSPATTSAESTRTKRLGALADADQARSATPAEVDSVRLRTGTESQVPQAVAPTRALSSGGVKLAEQPRRQLDGVSSAGLTLFNLGTFTNSPLPADVSLQLARQAGDAGKPMESEQVAARPPVAEPQVRRAVPAQEQAVTLADAEQRRQQSLTPTLSSPKPFQKGMDSRLENVPPAAPTAQSVPAQTPQTADVVLAKGEESSLRNANAPGLSALNRGDASVLSQSIESAQNARFARRYSDSQPAVLTRFGVEQRGDRLRVVDGDGSVYEGTLLGGNEAAPVRQLESVDKTAKSANAGSGAAEAKISTSGAGAGAGGAVQFRVSGTNRTLNVPVLLEGSFIAGTTGLPRQTAGRGLPGPLAPNESTNLAVPPPIERIVGRARIGSTNEISVNATRARN